MSAHGKTISEYAVNDNFSEFVVLRGAIERPARNNTPYLMLKFSDKSGMIDGRKWNTSMETAGDGVEVGKVLYIEGKIEEYNGSKQLNVSVMRQPYEGETYDPDKLFNISPLDGLDMYNQITALIRTFKDEDLKKLVLTIFEENKNRLIYYAAGKSVHHDAKHGLLYHIYQMIRSAIVLIEVYFGDINTASMCITADGILTLPTCYTGIFNAELLIAGICLHDIGKLDELDCNENGVVEEYTAIGSLMTHAIIGNDMITDVARRLNIKAETIMLLKHLVLSHMSMIEGMAVVKPMTLEAEMLARLDDLDAKIYVFNRELKAVDMGTMTDRVYALENRRLYRANGM